MKMTIKLKKKNHQSDLKISSKSTKPFLKFYVHKIGKKKIIVKKEKKAKT